MIRRIFVSSVQRELAAERKAIVKAIASNPQLARFFSTFAFEFDVPAADKRTDEIYLDARHFNVTVYRPQFDENGNRIPDQSGVEVGVESSEVGGEYAKVGVESPEVGVESSEVGVEIDFDRLLAANRKTFRMTCRAVWLYLANHPQASQSEMAKALKVAVSTAQSACNALKEVGLLVREGATKNGRWIVNVVGKK